MLAVSGPCALAFPSFPSHHKANHESGRRVLDVLALESENKPEAVPEPLLGKQGGDGDPTKLYEHGPKTWPSLALRSESDRSLSHRASLAGALAESHASAATSTHAQLQTQP